MAYTLACKDAGTDCPYVARGETEEEVLRDGAKHVKEGTLGLCVRISKSKEWGMPWASVF